jgi:hypothetical protein
MERRGPVRIRNNGNVANQAGHQTIHGDVYITQLVEDYELHLLKAD